MILNTRRGQALFPCNFSAFPVMAKRIILFLLLAGIGALATQAAMAQACGDGQCDAGEICADDCREAACGDGHCDFEENCPDDCVLACGDLICDDSEGLLSCADDCPSVACGDNLCGSEETCLDDGPLCEIIVECLDDSDCTDQDLCNGSEKCESGFCVAGTSLNCDDLDPCTLDSCEAEVGCVHTSHPGNGDCSGGSGGTDDDSDGGGVTEEEEQGPVVAPPGPGPKISGGGCSLSV